MRQRERRVRGVPTKAAHQRLRTVEPDQQAAAGVGVHVDPRPALVISAVTFSTVGDLRVLSADPVKGLVASRRFAPGEAVKKLGASSRGSSASSNDAAPRSPRRLRTSNGPTPRDGPR